jgi:hypothetical protein
MPPVREACPNELAPTSSTTTQLVLGDALAVALIEARGFTPTDFRVFHPGGKLGAQLCVVGDIMGTGEAVPRVTSDESLSNATLEMSRKRYGCTAVVDGTGRLIGAFTDGDLRRCIAACDLSDRSACTCHPIRCGGARYLDGRAAPAQRECRVGAVCRRRRDLGGHCPHARYRQAGAA